jgi:hypothetical protein
MRSRLWVWLCVIGVAALVGNPAFAAEGGAKAGGKAAKAPKAPTFKGVVSEKGADAAADVIAVLATKVEGADKTLNLLAKDDAVTAKIKDLAAKKANVTVKGSLTADGTGIDVTDIAEVAAKAGGKEGGARKKGGAKKEGGDDAGGGGEG